ncbi:MAG TPA: S9 family peptidase, partial [Bryobacteraceae bacterium]|nr:S9 family peptidase [Bryobacteraceae bacterium]
MRSFVVFCFACAAPAFAQLKVVTPEVAAQPPAHPAPVATPVWAPDGMSFAWRHKDGLHVYDIRSRSRRRVVATEALEGQAAKVPSEPAFTWENRRVTEHQLQWFPDGRTFLVSVGQDLFTVDVVSAKIRQLTSTAEAERDPKLSPDGKSVSFIRGNEVWVLPTAGGLARKLTSGSSATVWNGRTDWVYPEELDLGTAHWWSPDSRTIAFLQFDVSRQVVYPHAHLVPVEAIYEPQRYPKAGTPNADVKLGVVAADGGQVRWMDINGGNDSLLARVQWLPDSRRIAVQRLNRVQNRLDLVFVAGDSGEARTVLTETDPHWIDISNDLHFLDGEKFVWSSERSGYRHLYVFDESGKQVTQLTSGNFEIKSVVAVDRRQKLVYFESRERTPVGVDLWTVPLGGGTRNLITKAAGVHQVSMPAKSPQYYIDTWSTSADPTRKTLHSVSGEQLDIIVAVPPASTEYIYIRPEILTLKAADGETLYARLIRPSNFDSSKKYPAIVLAYGGPHAQDVLDVWMGLTAQQAFAQAGYVVWQLDNRGTAGRGQAFETKLYRRLGKQELEDQAHGVRHLLQMGF